MSEGPPAFPEWEVRTTRRCLTTAFGVADFTEGEPWASFARPTELREALGGRTEEVVGSQSPLVLEAELMGRSIVVWPDEATETLWVIDSRTRESAGNALSAGELIRLLPDSRDEWFARHDRIAAAVEDWRIRAPLLMIKAREVTSEEHSVADARGFSLLSLFVSEEGDLFAAIDLAVPALSINERARLGLAVITSARVSRRWEPCNGFPERSTGEAELCFWHPPDE